jgi:hypothetical protein
MLPTKEHRGVDRELDFPVWHRPFVDEKRSHEKIASDSSKLGRGEAKARVKDSHYLTQVAHSRAPFDFPVGESTGAARYKLAEGAEPHSPPIASQMGRYLISDVRRCEKGARWGRGRPANYRDKRVIVSRVVRKLFSKVCPLLEKLKSRQRTIGPA